MVRNSERESEQQKYGSDRGARSSVHSFVCARVPWDIAYREEENLNYRQRKERILAGV